MMTQEEYMKVKALRAAGWTISQIAEHLGYHPSTISGWLRNGGPPEKRFTPTEDLVLDERWQRRVAELLEHDSDLLFDVRRCVNLSLGEGAARVHVFKDIGLNIGRGETVGMVGPSGSGKSTLLMVMAGIIGPRRPEISFIEKIRRGQGR